MEVSLSPPRPAERSAHAKSNRRLRVFADCRAGQSVTHVYCGPRERRWPGFELWTKNEVGKLLNSDPPAFCTVVPAVSATMLINNDPDLWNRDKMSLERRVQLEQVYASGSAEDSDMLGRRNRRKATSKESSRTSLHSPPWRLEYLDLRASFITDASVRIDAAGAASHMHAAGLALDRPRENRKRVGSLSVSGLPCKGSATGRNTNNS